eukprot:2380521-Pyramimonas_sp.AAC.2
MACSWCKPSISSACIHCPWDFGEPLLRYRVRVICPRFARVRAMSLQLPDGMPDQADQDLDDHASTVAGWAEPMVPQGLEVLCNFIDKTSADLQDIFKQYGNPQAYLMKSMPAKEDQAAFTHWLRDMFPESDDTLYNHDVTLPGVSESDLGGEVAFCIHVSSLGFHQALCVFKNTFCEVSNPPSGGDALGPFWDSIWPSLALQDRQICAPTGGPLRVCVFGDRLATHVAVLRA